LLCVFHDEAEIITTALSMKCIAETEELWWKQQVHSDTAEHIIL
jgi:hypothetical protein